MAKRLMFFLFILLFVGFVSSISDIYVQTENTGIEIEYPKIFYLKQNTDFSLRFHTFNQTDGKLLTNVTTNCTFNLYNSSGDNILRIIPTFDVLGGEECQNCFHSEVLKGNFSNTGVYSYLIRCQTDNLGGAVSVGIEVNSIGSELTIQRGILYLCMFSVFFLILMVIPFVINALPSSNMKDEEGRILKVSWLKYFRPVLWFTEYMLFVALLFITSNLGFAYLGEELFSQFIFNLFRMTFGIAPLIVIVWIFWFFTKFFEDRQFQNMLNRGIFPQGKLW